MTPKAKQRRQKRLTRAALRRWKQRALRHAQRKFGSQRRIEIDVYSETEGLFGHIYLDWTGGRSSDFAVFNRRFRWRYVSPTPDNDDQPF